jgi:hypothetical protein
MSVMMYISFPRQFSLDHDYHGIQVVLIHIFLLTHIKIHIILKNKFLIIKAKYMILLSIIVFKNVRLFSTLPIDFIVACSIHLSSITTYG